MSQFVRKNFGFTLIELLVVISIIALLLGILVPVLGIAKKNANIMKESVNIRNMNLGMNTYGGTNKDWFPGLNSAGKYSTSNFAGEYYFASAQATNASTAAGATVDLCNNYALAVMLEDGEVAPAQLLSPGENGGNTSTSPFSFSPVTPDTTQGTPATSVSGAVAGVNSSYALLQYSQAALKAEWKGNQNQQAVVAGARMIFSDTQASPNGSGSKFSTVWTDSLSAKYKGALAHGDNSTNTESFNRGDITAVPTYFANLKYGSKVFSPNATSGTQVAIFGFHTATANYGGTSNLGQLGSVED